MQGSPSEALQDRFRPWRTARTRSSPGVQPCHRPARSPARSPGVGRAQQGRRGPRRHRVHYSHIRPPYSSRRFRRSKRRSTHLRPPPRPPQKARAPARAPARGPCAIPRRRAPDSAESGARSPGHAPPPGATRSALPQPSGRAQAMALRWQRRRGQHSPPRSGSSGPRCGEHLHAPRRHMVRPSSPAETWGVHLPPRAVGAQLPC